MIEIARRSKLFGSADCIRACSQSCGKVTVDSSPECRRFFVPVACRGPKRLWRRSSSSGTLAYFSQCLQEPSGNLEVVQHAERRMKSSTRSFLRHHGWPELSDRSVSRIALRCFHLKHCTGVYSEPSETKVFHSRRDSRPVRMDRPCSWREAGIFTTSTWH